GYEYSPTGTPWTFSAGGAGVSGNGSGFTSGNPNAPQGTQVAFLQGTGSLSQSIVIPTGTYTISFQLAQRGNLGVQDQSIEAFVDGNSVGTFTPIGYIYSSFTTSSFAVTAGAHTITFAGLNGAGDNTAFIDQIIINGGPYLTTPTAPTGTVTLLD